MKARHYLLFLLLYFPLTISQAKVYFHSNYERGETYSAKEIEPGQNRIALIPNENLEEWPKNGGRGTIEGNFPAQTDSFSYSKRNGNILKGVKGITRPHPRYADIQTGVLTDWLSTDIFGKGKITLLHSGKLFGQYCARIDCQTDSIVTLCQNIPAGLNAFHIRFYARFSERFLKNKIIDLGLLSLNYRAFFLPQIHIMKDSGAGPAGCVIKTVGMERIKSMREDRMPDTVAILPERNYCIEYHFAFSNPNSGRANLYLNGARRHSVDVEYKETGQNNNTISIGKSFEGPIAGDFLIDEFVLADSMAGLLPEKPEIFFSGESLRLRAAEMESSPQSTQWQLNTDNAWLLPLFDGGEDQENLVSFYPWFTELNTMESYSFSCKIPTGIEPGKEYFGRARVENDAGQWSEWSEPVLFNTGYRGQGIGNSQEKPHTISKFFHFAQKSGLSPIPYTLSPINLPEVKDAFFAEIGKRKPLDKIEKGKWYDFYLYLSHPKGWDEISFADIYLCTDPEKDVCSYSNRGGIFLPNGTYQISFSRPSELYAKQHHGSDTWTKMTGFLGLFVDNKTSPLAFNAKEGWFKSRIRILKEAENGPMLIKGFAFSNTLQASPMFRKLFFANEPPATEKIWPGTRTTAALVLFLLACAAFGFYYWRSRAFGKKLKEGKLNFSPEQEEIVPLEFDSPYDENIKKVKDYILNNYDKNISSSDVAEAIHVSTPWLASFFHKGTGKTVMQYINEVKIEYAKKLLKDTKLNISEIALKTGFSSSGHLNRVFSQLEKSTPKKYRKSAS